MNEREFAMLALMLPGMIIIGGVVIIIWGIRHATRQAELLHEERMAMIERGMTPPDSARHDRQRRAHGFKMSLGILLCGLGMGLLMLITFAGGDAGTGFGIGGAIAMVGIAFIVSAMFTERQDDAPRAAAESMGRRRSVEAPPPPEPPPVP